MPEAIEASGPTAKEAVARASQAFEAGDFAGARAIAMGVKEPPALAAAALEVAARAALNTRRHPGTWSDDLPPPPLDRAERVAAIALYRRAIAEDPSRFAARWEMSRLLDAASDERRVLLRELLPVRHTTALLIDLGDCHSVRGEHDAARDAYGQAIALDPSKLAPYARMELTCLRTGRAPEAKQWRRAASERPLPRYNRIEWRASKTDTPSGTASAPTWCAIANVVDAAPRGPGGELVREGTKHFKPGAKVYCFSAYLGDAGETARVVGRARRSHRWITIAMPTRFLRNARAKLCYEPAVLKRIADDAAGSTWSQGDAERLAALINRLSVATDSSRT
jgi:tetratricopeptide (TPR) repeat protein